MPLAPFHAALFDMDGLLLDSERLIRDAWIKAAQEGGVIVGETQYLQVVGRNEVASRGLFESWLGTVCSYAEVKARATTLIDEAVSLHGYAVKSGVEALLQNLKERGIPCAVASSTNHEEVERRLSRAGLRRFFVNISGGDEVRHGKPHPDLFLLAAQRVGQAPAHCLVFEDSEPGALGALAAGMSVVIVPDLKQPEGSLRERGLAVLASLNEAQPYLEEWFVST